MRQLFRRAWRLRLIGDAGKKLVAAEYFWDSDPGNGNGTPISVPPSESFTLGTPGTNLFNASVASLAAGLHQLGFRAEDASSNWSTINWLPVQVPGTPLVLLNGQFYSNNVVITTNGASYQVTLTSAYPNSTIFYTTDGSDPNGGATYSGPFNVAAPFSIRAIAYSQDFSQSAEAPHSGQSRPDGARRERHRHIAGEFYQRRDFGEPDRSAGGGLDTELERRRERDEYQHVRRHGWFEVRASGVRHESDDFGAGLVQIQPALALYPYGSIVRLTAVPTNSTTYFRQWGGAANGQFASPLDFVITTGNPAVSAVFFTLPANTHSLTVLIGDGNVTKTPQESNYLHNASVTITATPATGSVFVNWTGDTNSALNPLSVVMNTNKIITANFSTNAFTSRPASPSPTRRRRNLHCASEHCD